MSQTGFDRRDLAVIAIGGLVGATLRWWITDVDTQADGGWFVYAPNSSASVTQRESVLPWRTLTVNLLGALVLGAVLMLRRYATHRRRLWLTLGTGLCGSLTTFSTFAVEIAERFRHDPFPSGHRTTSGREPLFAVEYGNLTPGASAILYVLVSVAGGALAFWIGRRTARRFVT